MGVVGTVISVGMMAVGMVSSLFRKSISTSDPVISSVKITTSAYGLVRPVLYGVNRLSGNLIWYGEFAAFAQTETTEVGGKGGGQTYEHTTYNYSVALMLGLCEGPIKLIKQAWAGDNTIDIYHNATDKYFTNLYTTNWTFKLGTRDQTPWTHLNGDYAISYPNLAYLAVYNYGLGSSANLPNFTFIVEGLCNFYTNPATVTESYYSTYGMPSTFTVQKLWHSTVSLQYQANYTPPSFSFQNIAPIDLYTFSINYKCDNFLSSGRTITVTQSDSQGGLDPETGEWVTPYVFTVSAEIETSVWNGSVTTVTTNQPVMYYFYSYYHTITVVSVTLNSGAYDLVEVDTPTGFGEYKDYENGTFGFSIYDKYSAISINYITLIAQGGNPAEIITDIITNDFYGMGIDSSYIDMETYQYEKYCLANDFSISPLFTSQTQAKDVIELLLQITNSNVFWGDNKLIFIPYGDEAASNSYATWTPNLTPVINITYDDINSSDKESLLITRNTSKDAYNHVAIQHVNKDNNYNQETTEYQDQGDIIANGKKSMGTISANGIVDKTLALKIGRLLCKRTLKIRNNFKFSLPMNFIFLRPMDIVSLTSEHHNLTEIPLRLINVQIGKADIRIEAEDLGIGSSSVPHQPFDEEIANYTTNKLVPPGNANAPIMFVPPLSLANYEMWLATASPSTVWGGCHIWVSGDGTNYRKAGTMYGRSTYGYLTTPLGSSTTSIDTTNTISVSMATSLGELTSITQTDTRALRNLCYVDSEYISFADATLTDSYQYDLSYLVRGCHGSSISYHYSNSEFINLSSGNLFKYPITTLDIGNNIYVKLQSFNIYGFGTQKLENLPEYTYQIESPGTETNRGFTNLYISSNSVLPNTKMDIYYDSCDLTDDYGIVYTVGAQGFSIDFTQIGINGLDVSTLEADTWYYLFSICNRTQAVTGGLASKSYSSPILPPGYTYKRVIGAVKTNLSGNLINVNQIDYELFYSEIQADISSFTPYFNPLYFNDAYFNIDYFNLNIEQIWGAFSLVRLVPPISTRAFISIICTSGASDVNIAARKNGVTSTGQLVSLVPAGSTNNNTSGWVDTDLNQKIQIYVSPSPVSWSLRVNGFRFNI